MISEAVFDLTAGIDRTVLGAPQFLRFQNIFPPLYVMANLGLRQSKLRVCDGDGARAPGVASQGFLCVVEQTLNRVSRIETVEFGG